MFRVAWNINGKCGHGEYTSLEIAKSWVDGLNTKYNATSHWMEEFKTN